MNSDAPHTVDLIFQAVSVMVPVVTGYLLLFVGAMGKLWELSMQKRLKVAWRLAGYTLLAGVLSLGCWAGAMAGGIMFSTGRSLRPWWLLRQLVTPEKALELSAQYLSAGYTLFILSIVLGILTCWRSVRGKHLT
ncbi:MAG: hypothetical protein F6J97_04410 [Leptolyngbya sp. SIO4C1]|nr:hypothetical protein [Leptolyngbya sp. SIO4C1]